MAYNYEYPYTNVKENADWILHELKRLIAECDLTKKTVEDLKKEIEEHFSHFGEEIMKQLQFLIEDGTMQRLIQQAMLANLPTTHAHCSWFGQIVPTLISNGKAQGFCTYESGADTLAAQCFISDGSSEIAIVNMTTGNYVDNGVFGHNVLGHANSMTYDPKHENFFIACAGGDSTQTHIVRVNSTLTGVLTYSESIEAYAVAYAHDHLYCLVGDGNLAVYDINEEGELVISSLVIKRFNRRPETIAQGLYTDGKYLFIPNGNYYGAYSPTDNKVIANYIDVYDMQANFVTSMTVDTGLEIEEVSITHDIAYISCNSANRAVILKTQLYSSLQSFQSEQNLPMRFTVNNFVPKLYVNESYTGFFMDGTINRPLSNAYWIAQYYFMTGIAAIEIHMLSDISHDITLYEFENITIDFENHVMSKSVNVTNYNSFTLKNVTVAISVNNQLSFQRGHYTYLGPAILTGTCSAYPIFAVATQIAIYTVNLNQYTGAAFIRAIEGATIRFFDCELNGKRIFSHTPYAITNASLSSAFEGFYNASADNIQAMPNIMYSTAGSTVLRLNDLKVPINCQVTNIENDIGIPTIGYYAVFARSMGQNQLFVEILNRTNYSKYEVIISNGQAHLVV